MKTSVYVLISSYALVACSPMKTHHDKAQEIAPNTARGLEIDDVKYTNYTMWGCRDYVHDTGIVLERVTTNATFGDTIEDDIENMEKTIQEDKELRAAEDVKRASEAMYRVYEKVRRIKKGFILCDGNKDHAKALYTRDGINHRWDWNGSKFSFLIKPDGTGLYYDFRNLKDGEATTPKDLFKCEREFSNID